MHRGEVAKLLMILLDNYPNVDATDESVDRLQRYLHDFPFEQAVKNVKQHILTSKFPPNIAEIRGGLGEQVEKQRMKEETNTFFEKLDSWKKGSAPPPAGLKEALYAKLRKNDGD